MAYQNKSNSGGRKNVIESQTPPNPQRKGYFEGLPIKKVGEEYVVPIDALRYQYRHPMMRPDLPVTIPEEREFKFPSMIGGQGSTPAGFIPEFKKGGIYIKPSRRGSFTRWAKRHGYSSVRAAANAVMRNKGKYSPAIVKKANFAKNFGKGKKTTQLAQDGIYLDDPYSDYNDYATSFETGNPGFLGKSWQGIKKGVSALGKGIGNIDSSTWGQLIDVGNVAASAWGRHKALQNLQTSYTPSYVKVPTALQYKSQLPSIQRRNEELYRGAMEDFSNVTGTAGTLGRASAFGKMIDANTQAAIGDQQARQQFALGQQQLGARAASQNAYMVTQARRDAVNLANEAVASNVSAVEATSQELQNLVANARLGDMQSRAMVLQLLSTQDPEKLAQAMGLSVDDLMKLAGINLRTRKSLSTINR